MPLQSGNLPLLPLHSKQEMDSDVENIPDELPNQEDEFELFEPAGKMEIEDEVEESDDGKEEKVIQPKRRKHSHGHPDSKWKQTTMFFKELPSEPWRILLTIINIFSASLPLIYGNYTSLMTY